MKWLKWILIAFVGLIALLLLGSWIFLKQSEPDYNEKSTLDGLSKGVEVYYDDFAVPHIYASSEEDAYETMGYVHAKERLWQMELLRRIGPGRLSEILGPATLDNDRFFRATGIQEYTIKSVEYINNFAPPKVKGLVDAYISGVNQFIDNGPTPIEYTLLGIDKTTYTLEDVMNVMGYMAFSFAVAHKTEPILDYLVNNYGPEYVNDLDVHVDTSTTLIYGNEGLTDYRALSLEVDRIMRDLPVPELIGSNSWVVGPEMSETGQVLFANDPHIGFAQPCVWFEAHIEAPGVSLYGNYIAGYPFPQMGHTDRHAIGVTMFENDDIDFFREKINPDNPGQYWAIDKWVDFDVKSEEIVVKGADDVTISKRTTRHGPVLNDVIPLLKDAAPVAMYWVYEKFPNRLLELSYNLMSSKTVEEAQEAASLLHAPGLNIMYGDNEGNYAWWAAAKLPKRAAHVNSKLILDGSSGADDITEYYPFEDNPQAVNPDWGYVYSANNQSLTEDGIVHPGYYLPEDRARRIVKLLSEEGKKWGVDDFKSMLMDEKSENAVENIKVMTSAVGGQDNQEVGDVIDKLIAWDGTFSKNAIEPVIYTKWLYKTLEYSMKDELGESFDTYNGTHVMKRSTQPLIANESSVWWDNVATEQTESRSDIISKALIDGLSELKMQLGEDRSNWKWGEIHTLEHGHAVGANPTLRSYFNIGPFNVGATTDVINNLQFRLEGDGTYEVLAGPSCRRIVDFNDVQKNSWSILPTGQSGNLLSPHYDDQAEMFVNGQFRRTLMDEGEIKSNYRYKSFFSAKE